MPSLRNRSRAGGFSHPLPSPARWAGERSSEDIGTLAWRRSVIEAKERRQLVFRSVSPIVPRFVKVTLAAALPTLTKAVLPHRAERYIDRCDIEDIALDFLLD